MGTLIAKIHEEGKRDPPLPKGREAPCLKRGRCRFERRACEARCGGYAPDLRTRR